MSVWPAVHAFGSHRVPQRDLIANGAATMILNLGEAGALQFGEEPAGEAPVDGLRYSSDHTVATDAAITPLEEVRLTDGDLLVLM